MGDESESQFGLKIPGEAQSTRSRRPRIGSDRNEGESDTFSRWQDATREHLGYTVNLVMTLTVASLGYGANLLFKAEKEATPLLASARPFIVGSIALLFFAVVAALLVDLWRLSDSRWTARVARLRSLRRSYLKGRTVPLPEWIEESGRRESMQVILSAWEELRKIAKERHDRRVHAIENAIHSLRDQRDCSGGCPIRVEPLNPTLLKWAIGSSSEPGTSDRLAERPPAGPRLDQQSSLGVVEAKRARASSAACVHPPFDGVLIFRSCCCIIR